MISLRMLKAYSAEITSSPVASPNKSNVDNVVRHVLQVLEKQEMSRHSLRASGMYFDIANTAGE